MARKPMKGAAAPSTKTAPTKASSSRLGMRGDAGRQRAEQERTEAEARRKARGKGGAPFRFFMSPGDSKQVAVVDVAPDFFMYEHNIKDPQTGKWGMLIPCTKEFDNCPVCEFTDSNSYYAMFLTVIDFTEFTTKDGTTHEYSKKLMCVKPSQQKKFMRLFQKHKTLRGMCLTMTRDGDKDSAIGNDIEFDEFMAEDELTTYVREWEDREGKKHVENCFEPYEYDEIFQEPDKNALTSLLGGTPTPGSTAHTAALDDEDEDGEWEGDKAETPWEDDEPKATEAEEEEEPKKVASISRARGRRSRNPA